jgi:hypothetical protein
VGLGRINQYSRIWSELSIHKRACGDQRIIGARWRDLHRSGADARRGRSVLSQSAQNQPREEHQRAHNQRSSPLPHWQELISVYRLARNGIRGTWQYKELEKWFSSQPVPENVSIPDSLVGTQSLLTVSKWGKVHICILFGLTIAGHSPSFR